MDFDATEYLSYFLQDAEEHLEVMTEALLALEESPDDTEAISKLFRVAHTLKSSSAMVGLNEISEFTHHVEDFLSEVRDGSRVANEELVTALFRAFDLLKDMLEAVQAGTWETNKDEYVSQIDPAMAQLRGEEVEEQAPNREIGQGGPLLDLDAVKADWKARNEDGTHLFIINIELQPDTPMPGARAMILTQELQTVGTMISCVPDLTDPSVELEDGKFALALSSVAIEDEIRDHLDSPYIEQFTLTEVGAEEPSKSAPEVSTPEAVQAAPTTPVEPEPAKPAVASEETKPSNAQSAQKTAPAPRAEVAKTETVRVEIGKLDKLLELVGELVIGRGQVAELGRRIASTPNSEDATDLIDAIQNQGMILTQLQEAIMDSRMVPVANVFTRFRRLVRDLSVSFKKDVNLVIEGEETELDKKIIDTIGDPLTHLIRNAIDHGLEMPEDRVANGKDRNGRLLLAAGREGNNVTLTVEDDGRGLNVARIKAKAIERGLTTPEAAEQMDENSIIQMIFQPGFSTAEKVTDVSGRGVGMDVVKRSIDELGGTVEVRSKAGKGSTFVIRLPLTLAIIQALLIEVGEECYAIPIGDVVEMLRITPDEITTIEGRGEVIRLREHVIPLIRLREALGSPIPVSNGDERIYVAVVQQGRKTAGLVVDRTRGEQEVVIKSLGNEMQSSPLLAGASILGDGSVVLILDTGMVIREALNAKAVDSA